MTSHVSSQAAGSPVGAFLTVFWVAFFHLIGKTSTCGSYREDVDAFADPLAALLQGFRGIWFNQIILRGWLGDFYFISAFGPQ